MNVCFLTDIDELGGGERWALRASQWLQDHDHRASIAAPYGSPLYREALQRGLDVHGFYRRPGHPFRAPLRSFLERRETDVLYCTLIGRFHEPAALEQVAGEVNARRSRRRLAIVLKTGLPPAPGCAPEQYGLGAGPAVRRLHVVCEATRRTFLDWEPLFPEDYVERWREGVDLDVFDPDRLRRAECRRQWDLPDAAKAVVCVGRLMPDKGQRIALRVAREIVALDSDAVFLFAGEGADRPFLQQFAQRLGLNGAARFLGQVDDVASLLAAADVVFHPSLNESLPNALVEAAALGKPVVASAIQGVPEIVEHGETGMLVEPWDIDGQVRSLAGLLADESRRLAHGRSGRVRIRRHFDFAENTSRWAQHLAEIQEQFDRRPDRNLTQHLRRSEPIPVLFLMSGMRTGGEETEVGILAEALSRREFRVIVASASAVDEPSPVAAKLRASGVPFDEGCHSLQGDRQKVDHLTDLIRRERVRIVVACQDTALAYRVIQRFPPDACRLVEHGGVIQEVARIPKDRTDRYVGVSPAIADAAARVMQVSTHAVSIPSMVDTDRYTFLDRHDLRGQLGLSPEECIVTFVGRLDPKKRLEHLILAAGAILPTHPHVRFVVVGPPDAYAPDYARRIAHLAAHLTADGRFVFAGPRPDVPEILAASDILVLPSHGEGMSHVISEAGAAGLAVLATDDGAARVQLEDGHAGVLVPPDEPASLAWELARLIGDPRRRRSLGARLQTKVHREYAKRLIVPRWERLLRDVANGVPRLPVAFVPRIREERVAPFPAEIQIQTNTACNAKCIMCPYPEVSKEIEHGRMDEHLYREILAQCAAEPTLWRIEPFLMNEPFTDKRMVDLIALAKQLVPRATVTVTTNGSLLRPEVSDRLVHSGLDAIWFSFNGATKETYEKIMGISWDRVMQNIDYLLSIRPESLAVFTNMIQTEPMRPEIEENIRSWQARGVQSGPSKLVNRAGNVRNFTQLNYSPVGAEATHICDLLYHKMYVLHSGDVVLCCMDWRRQVILGNVKETPLREIWAGERYQHYRRLHEEGRSEELDLCGTCSYVLN